VDKLNLRLVRALQYLSQFRLDVRYRPGRQHIVPDALSRLSATEGLGDSKTDTLEEPFIFNTTVIELAEDFHKRLVQACETDKHWAAIRSLLSEPVHATTPKPSVSGGLVFQTGPKEDSNIHKPLGSAVKPASTSRPVPDVAVQKPGVPFLLHCTLLYHRTHWTAVYVSAYRRPSRETCSAKPMTRALTRASTGPTSASEARTTFVTSPGGSRRTSTTALGSRPVLKKDAQRE
jgi:hypothetical protein